METGLLRKDTTKSPAGVFRQGQRKEEDMTEKKRYRVAVTELLRKVVIVEAKDEEEAHQRASDAWQNGEYLLDGRNFDGAEFHVLGESEGDEEKDITMVDGKPGVDSDGAAKRS